MNDPLWLLFLRLGMLALIYLFLFQLIWLLRRSLVSSERTGRVPGVARLVVVESSGPLPARGHAFPLHDATSIGRGAASNIRIDDPFLSAEHALVSLRDGQAYIEDLGSTNGTFVNRRQIAKPTTLQLGDVVQVGQVKLKYFK